MTDQFELHPQLAKDCVEIAELPLCKLLLCNDATYPWFILVPRANEVQDIYQLEWQEQQQLLNESSMISELLMQEFNGDKMNVAALGNVVPQLHIHHVVRFKGDPAWPKPIWGQVPITPYSEQALKKMIERMQSKVSAILSEQ